MSARIIDYARVSMLEQLKLKGCSERSLALCCKFYLTYSGILQTVSPKSESKNNELHKIEQTLPD